MKIHGKLTHVLSKSPSIRSSSGGRLTGHTAKRRRSVYSTALATTRHLVTVVVVLTFSRRHNLVRGHKKDSHANSLSGRTAAKTNLSRLPANVDQIGVGPSPEKSAHYSFVASKTREVQGRPALVVLGVHVGGPLRGDCCRSGRCPYCILSLLR